MLRWFCLLLFPLLFGGCSSSLPADAIQPLQSVSQLTGTYSDSGKNQDGLTGPSLVATVFGREIKDATALRVSMAGFGTVRCEALAGKSVIGERRFTEGKDFKLADGRIPLGIKLDDMGTSNPQSMAVALGTQNRQILLASQGDAVIREKVKAGYLVLLVIPIVQITDDDYVYKRLR